jgi:hypothetical protein
MNHCMRGMPIDGIVILYGGGDAQEPFRFPSARIQLLLGR